MITHHHAYVTGGQVRTDIRVKQELFTGPTIDVAKRLVGAILYRRIPHGEPDAGSWLSGRIVETEAYLPLVDPSCHGYRGPTKRAATMYGRPGTAYVYFIYGVHWCFNAVTRAVGLPSAVLVRAVEPIGGLELMRARRRAVPRPIDLTNGPGKLCQAMGITGAHNRLSLQRPPLQIHRGEPVPDRDVEVTPRIGITKCAEWPLRWVIAGNPYLSRRSSSRGRQTRATS